MVSAQEMQNVVDLSSTQHPIAFLIMATVWLLLTWSIWKGLLAVVFGTNQGKLEGWERSRYDALQNMIKAGVLVTKTSAPKTLGDSNQRNGQMSK